MSNSKVFNFTVNEEKNPELAEVLGNLKGREATNFIRETLQKAIAEPRTQIKEQTQTFNSLQELGEYYKTHNIEEAEAMEEPTDDITAITILQTLYSQLFGEDKLTEEVEAGITSQYHFLRNRNIEAFKWMVAAFKMVAGKNKSKHTFGYIIGVLRQWATWGFGYMPTKEENEIVEYFEEITGETVSQEARAIINGLLGQYGIIKTIRMLTKFEEITRENKTTILANIFKQQMDASFSTNK